MWDNKEFSFGQRQGAAVAGAARGSCWSYCLGCKLCPGCGGLIDLLNTHGPTLLHIMSMN